MGVNQVLTELNGNQASNTTLLSMHFFDCQPGRNAVMDTLHPVLWLKQNAAIMGYYR